MSNIISLLPDSVANQIAAGEVVQRPASAVKELLENAIDAGADTIKLIIKDSGKTLIQVIDNGKGMSPVDARMCFERHATSKLTKAEDLFNIRTKGFRGEALASIAAVAQVELKTKTENESVGTQIIIEGSVVKSQEATSCLTGSNIQVKNLFFNIPARRNFLKSNPVELKHIIEELERVALVHPEIKFEMSHNGNEMFNLPVSNLRQRIVAIFGKNYNERLVPIEEDTPIVKVKGYLIKPEYTKKTRGEQFFFVNNRFIRSGYLHHAISHACDGIIPRENHPSYFIYLDVDPSSIDVNIHPTKTEIKFEDEKSLYAILHSAARRSLGIHNIVPSIDFEMDNLNIPLAKPSQHFVEPVIQVDKNYNPFNEKSNAVSGKINLQHSDNRIHPNWQELYEVVKNDEQEELFSPLPENNEIVDGQRVLIQLHKRYILCQIKSGFWIIDQSRAHERILFEKLIIDISRNTSTSQQQLFPQVVELSPADFALFKELEKDLQLLGFDISEMGQNSIAVNGIPADAGECNPQHLLEKMLEEVKHYSTEVRKNRLEAIARSLAKNICISPGKQLSDAEMNGLIDQLFACEQPSISAYGKPIIISYSLSELEKKFNS